MKSISEKNILLGALWSFGFITLESLQTVFLGSKLRHESSFLLSFTIFSILSAGIIVWTWLKHPGQFLIARKNLKYLILANITTTCSWGFYLLSVGKLEPVITLTLFSGAIYLTTLFTESDKTKQSHSINKYLTRISTLCMIFGLLWLIVTTLSGFSSSTGSNHREHILGIIFAIMSGVSLSFMISSCDKLDRAGLHPTTQIGLRLPLYIIVSLLAIWMGFDSKGKTADMASVWTILIAFPLVVLPMFTLQKAIEKSPPITIASILAMAPLLTFLLQMIAKDFPFSDATLVGLIIYCLGTVIELRYRTTIKT
ncbi:hypothetical protein AB835_13975 [Candidatus Endobugula sertula]|uniref:EamA domain-containing protein n=1 Tax=Candidatus Endobugula sertula TaxID=62101 RepID=A0A1D2QLL6_9GAMM|nr:hypothetical protein AB835_13975 [Candidatus Endobugula sertula]